MVQYTYSSHRTRHTDRIRKQRSKYPDLARKIVDISDVILEVLDARFFEESRNRVLEEEIEKQNKKIIYVLNKSDLIKKSRLNEIKGTVYPCVLVSCKKREGIKNLRDMIKRIGKTLEKKEIRTLKKNKVVLGDSDSIKVGVIGYPNTGKSSLINLLSGKSGAGVGSDAGFTKSLQKIKLSEGIVLIDSPGVIPEENYSSVDQTKIAKMTLLGGKSYTQIKDPEISVNELYKTHKDVLEKHFKVKSTDSDDFIEKVGREKNFLRKGDEVNVDKTSREILRVWQTEKI